MPYAFNKIHYKIIKAYQHKLQKHLLSSDHFLNSLLYVLLHTIQKIPHQDPEKNPENASAATILKNIFSFLENSELSPHSQHSGI